MVKLIQCSEEAKSRARLFSDSSSSKEDVGKAGKEIFILLYGGKLDDSLEDLRHRQYIKMAASASKMDRVNFHQQLKQHSSMLNELGCTVG